MNKVAIAARGSSERQDWATPPAFFAALDREFGFTLDVCATPWNATVARYFTEAENGLAQDWGREVCWCNPPYAHKAAWLRKAYEAAQHGATVVVLTTNETETEAWRNSVLRASELRLVLGRLAFLGADGMPRKGNTHGSAVVIFRPGDLDRPDGPRLSWINRDGTPVLPGGGV